MPFCEPLDPKSQSMPTQEWQPALRHNMQEIKDLERFLILSKRGARQSCRSGQTSAR